MEIFLRNEHPAVKPKSLCFLLPDRETPPSPARCSGLGGGRCKEPTARKRTNAVGQQIILICYQLPNHGGGFFIRTVRQGAKAARRPPTDFPVDAKQKSSFSSENTVFLRNLDFCISKSSKGEKRRGGRFPGKNKRTRAGERARGSVGEQPKERKARCSSGGESPDLAAVNIKTPSSGSGAPIKPLLLPGTELRIRIRVRK